jgi:cobalamin-dependent methionine synthase I
MPKTCKTPLFLIGQNLHILNPAFARAVKNRDEQALLALARPLIDSGAAALDINLGPGRDLAAPLCWLIETIQKKWPVPLFLPAGRHLPAALARHRGRATINAVTADPALLADTMKLARDEGADLVVLLTRPGLWRNRQQDQLQLALDVLEQSDAIGLALDNLYLDPVFSVRTDPVTWRLSGGMPDLDRVLELIALIGELTDGCGRTLLALGNGTLGLAADKRSAFHCRMLPLLAGAGLNAAILDCRDARLMEIGRSLQVAGRKRQKAA